MKGMVKKLTDITKLTKAASNTTSLRTTVPSSVVKQFGLVDGDCLEWVLEAKADQIILVVKPKKA